MACHILLRMGQDASTCKITKHQTQVTPQQNIKASSFWVNSTFPGIVRSILSKHDPYSPQPGDKLKPVLENFLRKFTDIYIP